MLKFVSEDMQDGEIAVLYRQGDTTLIMLNQRVTDPAQRTDAVNRLLSRSQRLSAR